MKLYHGSNIQIDTIDLSKSKPNKAKEMSLRIWEELSRGCSNAIPAICIQDGCD